MEMENYELNFQLKLISAKDVSMGTQLNPGDLASDGGYKIPKT